MPEDKLDALRSAVKNVRDLTLEAEGLEARAKEKRATIDGLLKQTLPELFDTSGVPSITIAAEGNMPAYEARCIPYYHANIKKDWPVEQRTAAFTWLQDNGCQDLIKTSITVELGLGDRDKVKGVTDALNQLKVPYNEELGVPWSTLTSFVKEQVEKHNTIPPLEKLGATIGRVVKFGMPKKK